MNKMNNTGAVTISKREYRELLQLKERIDRLLRVVAHERKALMSGEDLLRFSLRLKMKGGPKDLSAKMDSYLYG